MELQLLNKVNFQYLCKGLTLDYSDMQVIDGVLIGLNKNNGIIDKIIMHDKSNGFKCTMDFRGPQIIVFFDKQIDKEGKILRTATVVNSLKTPNLPPMIHINLHSPTLDIPQRVEIPLRYLVDSGLALENTYMVYLHVFEINNCEKFVYYGITKRGWMKRFYEHVKLALKGKSKRKFPQFLGESTQSRFHESFLGQSVENLSANKLTGSHHVVCTAGRTSEDAHQCETFLINKYSLFNSKGLNMKTGTKY